MLFLAIAVTVLAIMLFILIGYANGMSDNPSAPFAGGGIIVIIALIAIVCWIMWATNIHFNIGALFTRG